MIMFVFQTKTDDGIERERERESFPRWKRGRDHSMWTTWPVVWLSGRGGSPSWPWPAPSPTPSLPSWTASPAAWRWTVNHRRRRTGNEWIGRELEGGTRTDKNGNISDTYLELEECVCGDSERQSYGCLCADCHINDYNIHSLRWKGTSCPECFLVLFPLGTKMQHFSCALCKKQRIKKQ